MLQEEEEEEKGVMMADRRGRVSFGLNYGRIYQEWSDWTMKFYNTHGIILVEDFCQNVEGYAEPSFFKLEKSILLSI